MESHLPLSPPNTTSLSSPRALSGARSALTNHRLVSHSSNNCPITQKLINPQKDPWLVQSVNWRSRRDKKFIAVLFVDEINFSFIDLNTQSDWWNVSLRLTRYCWWTRWALRSCWWCCWMGSSSHKAGMLHTSHYPQRATHPLLNTKYRVTAGRHSANPDYNCTARLADITVSGVRDSRSYCGSPCTT